MDLKQRKLTDNYNFCCKNGSQPCPPSCYEICPKVCTSVASPPPYADDKDADYPNPKPPSPQVPRFLIIIIPLLAATFFFLSCYAIYRYVSARRRRRRSQRQQTENGDDFPDEEHGPVNLIDHPIWYIRTTGLQQSIITAITVCKYKKGEGLIEGTECSICLSEFEEDENLRLLPKCNHAFHLPCIDTWLRSHINCPMCRAPIVVNPAATSFLEPGVTDSGLGGSNRQMEIVGNNGENNGEVEENIDAGLRNEEEEDEGDLGDQNGRRIIERSNTEVGSFQPRRSISLDSSSAAKINLALSVESAGNLSSRVGGNRIKGKTVTGNENLATAKASSSTSTSSRGYSQSEGSYNRRNLVSSWYGRSQRKPSLPVRSF